MGVADTKLAHCTMHIAQSGTRVYTYMKRREYILICGNSSDCEEGGYIPIYPCSSKLEPLRKLAHLMGSSCYGCCFWLKFHVTRRRVNDGMLALLLHVNTQFSMGRKALVQVIFDLLCDTRLHLCDGVAGDIDT